MRVSFLNHFFALESIDANRQHIFKSLIICLENVKFVSQLVAPFNDSLFEYLILDYSVLYFFFLTEQQLVFVFFNALIELFLMLFQDAILR